MRRSIVVLILLSFAPLLCAQIYKWKDASGTVHYSETPPPTGTKFNKVNIVGSDVSTPDASASASASTTPAPASTASTTDTPANRNKLCNDLQHNLSELKGSAPLNVDDGKGHVVGMDANRRKQELTSAQSQYSQYCGH